MKKPLHLPILICVLVNFLAFSLFGGIPRNLASKSPGKETHGLKIKSAKIAHVGVFGSEISKSLKEKIIFPGQKIFMAVPAKFVPGGGRFDMQTFNFYKPNILPLTATQSQENVTCNTACDGSARVVASGGIAPYTYSWTGSGGTGPTITSLCPGTYVCTISDDDIQQITKTFTITEPLAIDASSVSQVNVSCNGGSNGSATVAPSGGTGGYTYSWAPSGGTGSTASSLTAGNYTVTISDANECSTTQSFTITQPSVIDVSVGNKTNVSCFGGSNGAAFITPSGGAGGYTYNWTPGNPTGDGTSAVTGLAAGTYTVTVTDANSCTASRPFVILQPTVLATNGLKTDVSCFGGSNGSANVLATGGIPAYTYSWSPSGGTSATASGLPAGNYTVTVTDNNGCTATRNYTLTEPPVLSATPLAQTNISCNGGTNGSATVSATGGTPSYAYSWSPSGGTAATATGLSAGTFTVTVTDANSCTATQSFTITEPSVLFASAAAQTNVSCNGGTNGSATVSASGGTAGYTYSWSPAGGTAATASGLAAGTYTATVTDANGCTATQSFTITEPTGLSAVTGSHTNVSCNGGSNGSATVSPAGGTPGYTYSWSPSGGTGASATGLSTGTYTVTVTDANGCQATHNFSISQPAVLIANAAAQTNISCNGGSNGSASVEESGGTSPYTYSWSPAGGTSATASGLEVGTYVVTVTDAKGCTVTQSFTLTEPPVLSAIPAAQTNISCNGGTNGSATVSASGGTPSYTYLWSPSGGTAATATGLSAGTYTVTVTDANSCTTTQSFTITEPSELFASAAAQTNVSCNGGTNGSATVSASGGTSGYTYSWSPAGGTAATASGLAAGTYTATVTDANGCTATQSFTITQPTGLSAVTGSHTNVSCYGGSNGSATVSPAGGTPNYTYSWSPSGGTGASATGLGSGVYTVTVTDANGCTATHNFSISQPPVLNASPTAQTNISCNGGSNGSASVTVSGGTGTYTYSWVPTGGTAATATGLAAGNYTVTVTDANGCTTTQNFTITQPSAITATTAHTNVSCNSGSNGTATVTASGGVGSYTYSWAPSGGTGATASGLTAGSYTCTITDANSCSILKNVIVTQPPALTATTSSSNVSCAGSATGSATVVASGGTATKTYSWSPSGGTAATANNLAAGTYTCTITDDNLCSITKTVTVTEPTSTPGDNNYTLPETHQAVNQSVNTTSFVPASCEIVSTVMASGTSPVNGIVTSDVWVESSVPTDNGLPFVQRHYQVAPGDNAATATGTVTLYFSQAEFDNFNAHPASVLNLPEDASDEAGISNLRIGKYSGVSSNASGLPASYTGATSVIDPADNKIVWNSTAGAWEVTFDVDGFSGFIVQTEVSVLPVNWVSFTIKEQGQSALLNWATSAEQNSKNFTVQRSSDGINWTNVATVPPALNNGGLHNYSFLDNNTVAGYNYYRILQTEINGATSYSEMRLLKISGNYKAFTVLGNLVNTGVVQVQVREATDFSLYETNGKLLWKKQFAAGLQSIDVSKYAKGIYFLRTKSGTQKIVIQ